MNDDKRDEEEWLPIPLLGFEGYEVSSHGRFRSWRKCGPNRTLQRSEPKIMRQRVDRFGYMRVGLGNRGHLAHALVLAAFVGPRPVGLDACHNDGNRLNNHADNLRWDSRTNNHADKRQHGTQQRGEEVNCAKLTADQVRSIRANVETLSIAELAKEFGVSNGTIDAIRRGRTWRHVI